MAASQRALCSLGQCRIRLSCRRHSRLIFVHDQPSARNWAAFSSKASVIRCFMMSTSVSYVLYNKSHKSPVKTKNGKIISNGEPPKTPRSLGLFRRCRAA
jgi:hypothetical protein